MKKISPLIAAMLLLTSSVNTQDIPESRTNLGNTSTLELRQFRDAWLFGDDESVSVRLESLENDNRLQGVLPRWIGLMRAGHSLRMGKPEIAEQSHHQGTEKCPRCSPVHSGNPNLLAP